MTAGGILFWVLVIEVVLCVLMLMAAPEDLWLHYAAIMNLGRVARTVEGLTPETQKLGTYVLIRGYVYDVLVNMLHMTCLLRELPQIPWWAMTRGLVASRNLSDLKAWAKVTLKYEWIVPPRLTRHCAGPDGFRKDLCMAIRTKYLDRLDTKHADGVHR